jgi:hypothetical protein
MNGRKSGFSMVAMLMVIMILGVLFAGMLPALAGDRGPQVVTASITGTTGTVTPIGAGGTGRFTPTHIVFGQATGVTNTLTYVSNGTTNTLGSKTTAASDFVLVVSNVPPMFAGDAIRVSATVATNAVSAVSVIGDLFD